MLVRNSHRKPVYLIALAALFLTFVSPLQRSTARAANTPTPSSVTIAGSLQSELGCSGDWLPDCATTHMTYDANSDVWRGSWTIPAGSYEYKAALNDSWTENYGLHAQPGGANIPLNLAASTAVKFYYDHKSHWVTDNQGSVIASVPGNFQAQLGCSGDWDPACLRTWLEDPSGSGSYTFETTGLVAGDYQAKVALDESWTVNYGQGGVPGGANINFHVPVDHAKVTFRYDPTSHVLTILAGHAHDNNVEWDGLRHDSRDTLYRTPGGAVPAGSAVKIRFRTFHDDVTSVTARVYDINANAQKLLPMSIAASDVSCYQPGLETETCDYWTATLSSTVPNNLWYRFIIADGTKTAYYADNTSALDGGLGSPSDNAVDNSYALMFYDPGFTTPAWVRNAVIYQIFPDRFRNGDKSNDPKTGAPRYDDPVLALPWGTLPEGYCRNYADAPTNCPWRFDANPPLYSPQIESPRGRDYFGGDLKGVTDKLDYLKTLGVTAIYFNPIFYAQSNHRYDTANYLKIDPALGDLQDFRKLVKEAKSRGIRIILDGVFNHMSSDSPTFDRYHHFSTVGACESATSPFRSWFTFRPPSVNEPAPCVPSIPNGNDTFYTGWAGFDSIPVLTKSNPDVQSYFVTGNNSVSRYWLQQGSTGWRLDVMGDPSFPTGYWEAFRQVVKQEDPDALIIGELWQKDSTLLRFLRGDRADTTMNYRLRDAVIGFLSPGNFDPKGFGDSGHPLKPSEFTARLQSMREDYSNPTYYALMNLLDSHDTERLLWTLTPGAATTADKEQNATNVAAGKQRMRLASLIQFTLPGAPTLYYGDEVALTGADDPDDRRTYPWPDQGGHPDPSMLANYRALTALRSQLPALRNGDFRVLLSDDISETVAYGRKTGSQAAIVIANRSSQTQTIDIPVAGYLPDGLHFAAIYTPASMAFKDEPRDSNFSSIVNGGLLRATVGPMSGLVLATRDEVNLTPPAPPANLHVTAEGNAQVSLAWTSVKRATAYNVYRSPLSGGGWVKANTTPVTTTSFTDTGLRNAQLYYYVVKALDNAGNESGPSNEVSAIPHYVIGWANLQWPPTLAHTISAVTRTDNVYGQVWIDGVTNQPGQTRSLRAQLGFGPAGSNPAGNPAWTWVEASFNTDAGNNDEFVASLLPDTTGTFDYLYRYTTTGGRDWLYADLNGPIPAGSTPPNPGKLTVTPSSDSTPPIAPANLHVTTASPTNIGLAWDAVTGDPTLYGYEVRRSGTAGGPYTTVGLVTGASSFDDASVIQGSTYYYVVRSVDTSFNRSGPSSEVSATAQLRNVTVVLNVTVPTSTDGTAKAVHIAGTLSRLNGGLPDWDPTAAAATLTRVDATHWTITLSGLETTQIEYKYALGDWNFVEKDASCGEIANRQLTLSYGSTGTQTVNDTVPNWRNVSPCGN